MNQEKLSELSDNQLLDQYNKEKSSRIIDATLIGFLIGISVYSFIKNGLGFWGFFPLLFAFILFTKKNNFKAIETEVKSRNLQ